MSNIAINVTIGAQLSGQGDAYFAPQANEASGAVATLSTTTVAANVATLVADGASPTQAHVNTLNTNWATLLAAINNSNTAITGDVTVVFSAATITTQAQLKAALQQALILAVSAGNLTP